MSETILDQSTATYRTLFNFMREAIFVVNGKTGMIVDANPAAETLIGRSLSEIREMHHGELHPTDEAGAARQAFTEFVRNPAAFRAKVVQEWEVLHRDGRSIPVDILAEIFAGPDGTPLVFSIFHDASARKKAEQSVRDSELKYRRLYESLRDAVATIDLAGHILECNPAFEAMVGYTAEELRQMTYRDLTPQRWHEDEARILAEQVLTFDHSEVYEKEYRRRDGTVFPVELRTFLLRDEGRQPIGMWAIVRDITQRRRAEKALRESERRFRALFDSGFDGVLLTRTDGSVQAANPVARAMFGMTEQEICRAGRDGLIVYDDRLREALETRRSAGRVQSELTFIRKDGSRREAEVASMVLDESGQAFVIIRDITERKRTEEALRVSERKFATLFRSSPISITVSDLNDGDRFVEVNEAFEKFTGHPREGVIGRTYPPDWLWQDAPEYAQAVAQFTSSGQLNGFEFRFRHTSGELRNGQLWARVIDFGGKPCVLAMTIDITERKRAEAALTESNLRSERQLREIEALYTAAPVGLCVLDNDLRWLRMNNQMAEIDGFSVDEHLGRNILEALPGVAPIIEPLLRRVIESGQPVWGAELSGTTPAQPGVERTWLASYYPLKAADGRVAGINSVLQEITERKRAEAEREHLQEQLAHAQKMECVGRLAGGIAHDFNNLMSVILMHTETTMDELDGANPVKESIAAIQDAAEKAVALGRQLMTFSKKEVLQTELLDVNSVIAENHKMLRRLIGEDVRVVFNPGPTLLVKADRGQLGQIIVNLAVNSRDAMPQGGIFEIETCRIDFDEGSPELNPAAKPGPCVVLKVRDSGTGMDAETRLRIFEPFFTTKGAGKGTGLGLSVVYGIVSQMGGFIAVESEPGRGTEFRVYLPAASETQKVASESAAGPIPGGSETVLLTEDERALREKLGQVLAKAGYRVLLAAAGDQAFQMSIENPVPIHLLVTDIVMPEMSGYRLAERLLILRPSIKVLYMSGYPDAGDESITLPPERNFIQKPFTKEKLLRRVREVLDAGEPRV